MLPSLTITAATSTGDEQSEPGREPLEKEEAQEVEGDGEEVEGPAAADSQYLVASSHRGVLTALMNLSMGLSQIVSATLGGLLINWWGDITVVFVVSGVLCVAVNGVVAVYGLSSERKTVASRNAATSEEDDEEAVGVAAGGGG